MLLKILRIAYFFVCTGAIAGYFASIGPTDDQLPQPIDNHPVVSALVLLAITQLVTVADVLIRRKRIDLISATYFGLLIGILLAYLTNEALLLIIPEGSPYRGTTVMINLLVLPYLCVSLLLQTRDDFRFIIPYVEFARDLKSGRPLLIDSSSLIDGRIVEVVETQILESQMLVPDFILAEVQDIADSSDKNRRIRGRRGLEVLASLQQCSHIDVRVHETKTAEFRGLSVDQKLVEVAKSLRAGVITNDFNLNKVASVQNITVINLNDVANALRPQFLPGERLRLQVMREGDGEGQGVGYLDDGTMVVCEGASNMIGKEISTVVTRVLQSSAGRMIFSKPLHASNSGE
ncbi:MAG: PIN/TRAM domain-containing protein [Fuerstiella sp.]|nr:PIN/TRAM domain-containing protein [Fuerstiella sp.]